MSIFIFSGKNLSTCTRWSSKVCRRHKHRRNVTDARRYHVRRRCGILQNEGTGIIRIPDNRIPESSEYQYFVCYSNGPTVWILDTVVQFLGYVCKFLSHNSQTETLSGSLNCLFLHQGLKSRLQCSVIRCSKIWPFKNWSHFYYLNTEQVQYGDPHCTLSVWCEAAANSKNLLNEFWKSLATALIAPIFNLQKLH